MTTARGSRNAFAPAGGRGSEKGSEGSNMSGLLGLLGLGAGAISAQNAGVAVSGRNTANVNTEGYSQERIDFESLRGVPSVGGVLAGDPQRYADDLLAGRERMSDG